MEKHTLSPAATDMLRKVQISSSLEFFYWNQYWVIFIKDTVMNICLIVK